MLKPETFDSNQQFINAWSYIANACPQGEMLEADGLAIAFLLDDDLFHLGWVATLPDYKDRGYAEAVSRHALEQAAQRYGKKLTALHATPAGFPLYQRMGYQPTAYFRTYRM